MSFDTSHIVMLLIILAFVLTISITTAFTIVSYILHKSNNLGTRIGVKKTIDGGFVICEKGIVSNHSVPSKKINNPAILKNLYSDNDESYLNDKTLNTLENEIDSVDLSGISWHK